MQVMQAAEIRAVGFQPAQTTERAAAMKMLQQLAAEDQLQLHAARHFQEEDPATMHADSMVGDLHPFGGAVALPLYEAVY